MWRVFLEQYLKICFVTGSDSTISKNPGEVVLALKECLTDVEVSEKLTLYLSRHFRKYGILL